MILLSMTKKCKCVYKRILLCIVMVVVLVLLNNNNNVSSQEVDNTGYNTFKLVRGHVGVLLMPTDMNSVLKVNKKTSKNNTFFIKPNHLVTHKIMVTNTTSVFSNDIFVVPLAAGMYRFDVDYANTSYWSTTPGYSTNWSSYVIYRLGEPKYIRYTFYDGILGVAMLP
jgi:hypothetical protein